MKRLVLITIIGALLAGTSIGEVAAAQRPASWNGTWSGAWGGVSTTSMTIVGGKVARYQYQGKPVPITIEKIEGDQVTFGVAERYAIRMVRTGPSTATATYTNFQNNDTAAADLTRE